MRLVLTFMILMLPISADAVPDNIAAMNNLPNAGQLYLDYCLTGHSGCVTVEAVCYGQCCSQTEADDMGYGCSGDVRGSIPPGLHYAGWSCQDYKTGKKVFGEATRDYDHSNCHNRR